MATRLSSLLIALLGMLAINISFAQSNNYEWALSLGGVNVDEARGIVTDASGNVYLAGTFQNTVDFDPSSSTMELTSAGGNDIFITKIDPFGYLIWAERIGGIYDDQCLSLKLDALDNVLLTGHFNGVVDFNPGPAIHNLYSQGDEDVYILKLDTNASFQWVRQFSGEYSKNAFEIAIDKNDNIYTTGEFFGEVDFDPGPGIYNLISMEFDAFVSKLDVNGDFLWVRQFQGPGMVRGKAISVDDDGNVYTSGIFTDITDFDPGPAASNLTPNAYNDIYLSKLNLNGNFEWVRHITGDGDEYVNSMVMNANGDLHLTGAFTDKVDFDPGKETHCLTSWGSYDVFVCKLNFEGDYIWAVQFEGLDMDDAFGIALDAKDNVYTTGYFTGSTDFDPSDNTVALVPFGASDVFVSKLTKNGDMHWVRQLGGIDDEMGSVIAVDMENNVYTAGHFFGSADFDPSNEDFLLSAQGNQDVFLHKMNLSFLGIEDISEDGLKVYPNPTYKNVFIDMDGSYDELTVIVRDVSGRLVQNVKFDTGENKVLELNGPSGLYILEVLVNGNERSMIKVVKY